MKFGILKTLVEEKLVESFKMNNLKSDLKFFKKNILSDKNFKKYMFVYQQLSENKGLDKETSKIFVEDLLKKIDGIKVSKKTFSLIESWTKNIVCENKYDLFDDLVYENLDLPENKSVAKKKIIESISKTPKTKKTVSNIPVSSMLKVANNTAKKYLESLNETDRKKVVEILTSDSKVLKDKFIELKESTLQKLDTLLNESDDTLKEKLSETKNKISESKFNKKEFIKLFSLNNNLI